MSPHSSISHVIFDLDGLLITTGGLYFKLISDFLAKYGHTYTHEVRRKLMGRQFQKSAKILVEEYNLPVDPSEIVEYVHSRIKPESWRNTKFLPGAAQLIEYFAAQGVPMAVATGSEVSHLEHKMHNGKDVWAKMHHIVATGGNPEVCTHHFQHCYVNRYKISNLFRSNEENQHPTCFN